MENHILVLQCFYPEVANIFSTQILLDNASHVISPNFKGAEKCNPPSGWKIDRHRKWVDSGNASHRHLPQERKQQGENSQAALCWWKIFPFWHWEAFLRLCGTCSVNLKLGEFPADWVGLSFWLGSALGSTSCIWRTEGPLCSWLFLSENLPQTF